MRFHLRHASAGSSFKLCLLKTSSLCLARRASRPFFFPLASTKPPLSEPGRSFGPFTPPAPLGALGKPSAVFGSHSLEIFLSPLLPGSSPGGRLQPLPLLFRVRLPPGFSSRRRVGVPRTLSTSPFLSIFFEMFFREKFQTHKKYFIINILRFHFFLIKKPLSSRKRPKGFRNPKCLSSFSSWLRIDGPKAIPEGRLQHLSSPGRNLFPPLPYSSSPHSRRHCIRHHPSY